VAGAQDHILETLSQLGITWQEGPDIGGPHAPYIQSQRLDIYKEWGQKLVDAGLAYADPYSPEEVQAFREAAQKDKRPFLYRNHRPANPPAWDGTQPLRLKSTPKAYRWHDEVMGDLSAGEDAIDDLVLIKSDGYPTYNFCNIIDDHLMKISHVIRSQEFLASMPKYLNIYEALDIPIPQFATLPYIMGPDGKRKLSKRDGAKDALDYLRDGYLPEALLNFLATLGWNDGTEQEVFSVQELIEKFSLERVQKSGAKFDEQRLLWLNGAHIRAMSLDDLYIQVASFWPESAQGFGDDYRRQVLSLVQERLKFFKELPLLTEFFFAEPAPKAIDELLNDPKNKQLRKLSDQEKKAFLQAAHDTLVDSDFSENDLETRLNKLLEQLGTKPGILFSLIRIATTGAPFSPGLFETLHTLGKEKSLSRLRLILA
jgi:glutamyl-tRNA synthetase